MILDEEEAPKEGVTQLARRARVNEAAPSERERVWKIAPPCIICRANISARLPGRTVQTPGAIWATARPSPSSTFQALTGRWTNQACLLFPVPVGRACLEILVTGRADWKDLRIQACRALAFLFFLSFSGCVDASLGCVKVKCAEANDLIDEPRRWTPRRLGSAQCVLILRKSAREGFSC